MKRFNNPVFLEDPKLSEEGKTSSDFLLGVLTGFLLGIPATLLTVFLYYLELS